MLDLDVEEKTTQRGLIERMTYHLDQALGQSEPARKFLKEAWSFLQRVRVMDSGIEASSRKDNNDEILLDQFAFSLSSIIERICRTESDSSLFNAHYDGILLLIDESDNCSFQLNLGSFIKLLLERLQRRGCNQVLVGLAGLPELRSKLYTSHPSSVRIFQECFWDS